MDTLAVFTLFWSAMNFISSFERNVSGFLQCLLLQANKIFDFDCVFLLKIIFIIEQRYDDSCLQREWIYDRLAHYFTRDYALCSILILGKLVNETKIHVEIDF